MMNPIRTMLLTGALAVSLGVATPVIAEAKCPRNNMNCQAEKYIDVDGNGICDNCTGNYVDADGDGICDNCTGNYVDANGDGVCDNRTSNTCNGNRTGKGSHHGHK